MCPPCSSPRQDNLLLCLLECLVLLVGRLIICIYKGSRFERRKYRSTLVVRDSRRERIPPRPVSEPAALSTGAVRLFCRLVRSLEGVWYRRRYLLQCICHMFCDTRNLLLDRLRPSEQDCADEQEYDEAGENLETAGRHLEGDWVAQKGSLDGHNLFRDGGYRLCMSSRVAGRFSSGNILQRCCSMAKRERCMERATNESVEADQLLPLPLLKRISCSRGRPRGGRVLLPGVRASRRIPETGTGDGQAAGCIVAGLAGLDHLPRALLSFVSYPSSAHPSAVHGAFEAAWQAWCIEVLFSFAVLRTALTSWARH